MLRLCFLKEGALLKAMGLSMLWLWLGGADVLADLCSGLRHPEYRYITRLPVCLVISMQYPILTPQSFQYIYVYSYLAIP